MSSTPLHACRVPLAFLVHEFWKHSNVAVFKSNDARGMCQLDRRTNQQNKKKYILFRVCLEGYLLIRKIPLENLKVIFAMKRMIHSTFFFSFFKRKLITLWSYACLNRNCGSFQMNWMNRKQQLLRGIHHHIEYSNVFISFTSYSLRPARAMAHEAIRHVKAAAGVLGMQSIVAIALCRRHWPSKLDCSF